MEITRKGYRYEWLDTNFKEPIKCSSDKKSDALIELLDDLHEYMDNIADCDTVNGVQYPNKEMQFMVRIDEIKKQLDKKQKL